MPKSFYRSKADECRQLAAQAASDDERDRLNTEARHWRGIAQVEERLVGSTRKTPPPADAMSAS
jgi:hypothetical protein